MIQKPERTFARGKCGPMFIMNIVAKFENINKVNLVTQKRKIGHDSEFLFQKYKVHFTYSQFLPHWERKSYDRLCM